jgi:hypothetical protein
MSEILYVMCAYITDVGDQERLRTGNRLAESVKENNVQVKMGWPCLINVQVAFGLREPAFFILC